MVKKRNRYESKNIYNQSILLPKVIYAKTFGYTFIFLILLFGVSVSMIFNTGIGNILSCFKYQVMDTSVLRYISILFIMILATTYEFIVWICIISGEKYIKFTNKQITYKSIFKSKVIDIKNIKYIDFEYTDNGILKPKRIGILFKCDNNISKINKKDLFVNFYEFPQKDLTNIANFVFKLK